MDLIISSEKGTENYSLQLKKGRLIIAKGELSVKGYLDAELIKTVDKFLKENRINPLSLNKVLVKGLNDKTSSKQRIISTFAVAASIQC